MTYSDALIIFCCNSIIVLSLIATIEFFKQREKILARKKEVQNIEKN
jgi:hypothetical protein